METQIKDFLIIGFDIETTPFSMIELKTEIIGFYIYNYNIDIYFNTPQEAVNFILSSKKDVIFVGHNIQFDLEVIFNNQRVKNPIIDLSRDKTIILKKKVKFNSFNIHGDFPHFASLSYKIQEKIENKNYSTRSKTVNIHFIDLFNFLKFSLEDLMKAYTPELAKYKQQYITLVSPSGITLKTKSFDFLRNKADIEATTRIYAENFFKDVSTKESVKPVLSIASYSFKALLEKSLWEWENKKEKIIKMKNGKKKTIMIRDKPIWLQEIERLAYHGGLVIPNPKFLLKPIPNAKYFDVNSLYAFIMMNLKVPTKFLKFRQKLNLYGIEAINYIKKSYKNEKEGRIFYISCIPNEPILPVYKEGKLTPPKNELIEGWYCENELYYALFNPLNKIKLDNLIIYKEVVYKTVKYMFKSFVLENYEIKKRIDKQRLLLNNFVKNTKKTITKDNFISYLLNYIVKEDKELFDNIEDFLKILELFNNEDFLNMIKYENWREAERNKAKLLPNSSYGRFAMKQRLSKVLDEIEDKYFYDMFSKAKSGDIYIDETKDFGFENQKWTIRKENGIIFLETVLEMETRLGSTAVACFITAGARALLMEYYDEDKTIYTDTDSQVRTDDIPTGLELGEWKIEKEGTVTIFGKKWYSFDEKLKAKGVPKKVKLLSEKEYLEILTKEVNHINKQRILAEKKIIELKNDFRNYHSIFSYLKVVKPREAKRRNLPSFTQVKTLKKLKIDPKLLEAQYIEKRLEDNQKVSIVIKKLEHIIFYKRIPEEKFTKDMEILEK